MKVLLIGNREHQLLFNLIGEIKKSNDDFIFDILSQDSNNINDVDLQVYNEIYTLNLPKILLNNRFIRGVAKQLVFRRKISNLFDVNYDFIHIHYIEDIILRDIDFFVENIKSKLIVSVWGSDFLRADITKKEQMRKLFRIAHKITISNILVANDFRMYYQDESFCSNIEIVKFFVKPLNDLIEGYKINNFEIAKEKLNIVQNKLVVTIGYNASKMQQHLLIFESLFNNIEFVTEYKDQIHFILPLTYPKDKVYISIIKDKLNYFNCSYSIFDTFLSNEELLNLRYCSDIFIQLQTTDMMSGSMLEYLFLGNQVITGSWLPYNELKDNGVSFCEIDDIDQIGNVMNKLLKNKIYRVSENMKIIHQLFGRDILIKKWAQTYEN